jgi:hypothetical protein
MWLVKGVLSGLALFGVFTLVYLRGILGPIREGVATGVSVLAGSTIYRPLYWAVLAFTIRTSCLWARLLHLVYAQRPPM